jgi:hypothetical protein
MFRTNRLMRIYATDPGDHFPTVECGQGLLPAPDPQSPTPAVARSDRNAPEPPRRSVAVTDRTIATRMENNHPLQVGPRRPSVVCESRVAGVSIDAWDPVGSSIFVSPFIFFLCHHPYHMNSTTRANGQNGNFIYKYRLFTRITQKQPRDPR